jgi:hypothetical protein
MANRLPADRTLRAAFLAGAYALADSLGLDEFPSTLFVDAALAWEDRDELGRPLPALFGGDA